MNTVLQIIKIVELALLAYLGLNVLYIFFFSVAGNFRRSWRGISADKNRKMAVLIPGYKEDQVIVHVAEHALQQDYPSEYYDVIIIADSFQESTLDMLRKLPVKIVEVSFELSTKSKALNKAMDQLPEDYDLAVILDADNLMEQSFLTKINHAFDENFLALQGHRVAKNTDTSFAILDAISEEINNHIFRQGHRAVSLSSALIGSAMAFDYLFFKNAMKQIKAIGGFDKELELKFAKERIKIEYLDKALVYDEKIQSDKSFSSQRRRWLSAQFIYFSKSFGDALKQFLLHGNIEYFNKSIQFVQLPRVLLIGITTILLIIALIFGSFLLVQLWVLIWVLCVLALFMAVPRKFYNRRTLKAVLTLPKTFMLMFLSLFRLKGANKKFIHTPHTTTGDKNNS